MLVGVGCVFPGLPVAPPMRLAHRCNRQELACEELGIFSEAGALSLRWNLFVSLQIFHPSPLRRANELGETCNRDSPSSRFYFVTANSLVRLALSAPAYYQVDFFFPASLAGELAPVCVVLPLLVVFPQLWVYLENPIPLQPDPLHLQQGPVSSLLKREMGGLDPVLIIGGSIASR